MLSKIGLVVLASVLVSLAVSAAPHEHGKGQLLIAQDGNNWRFEFVLPGADLLGFEHKPSDINEQQQARIFIDKVERHTQILTVPSACKVINTDHVLDSELGMPSKNSHVKNEHAHTHSDKHGSQQHEQDLDTHQQSHIDIRFTYIVNCSQTEPTFNIGLFALAPSLHAIEAQWITQQGQGASVLHANTSTLSFN